MHFFDDFSSGIVGKKPLNWKSTLDNTGASSIVAELKGLDGQWAAISGFRMSPTGMKTPCREESLHAGFSQMNRRQCPGYSSANDDRFTRNIALQ